MARGKREIPPCCKRYGSPLFCVAWVPVDKIAYTVEEQQADKEKEENNEAAETEQKGEEANVAKRSSEWTVVLGGGGGEGRSGVPNAIIFSEFDLVSKSLSDQPMYRLGTEDEVPYRMSVHPAGDGILCSFPKRCRWFDWSLSKSNGSLALKSSDRLLSKLEDVGLQLALSFSPDGSLLATGGEDGYLRVFRWPSMEIILDKSDAHTSIKDLDFSSDGKFLISLGDSGPCRVWDTSSCSVVGSLPRENGENFRFCRFSHGNDNSQILYIIAMQGERGIAVSWDPVSWERINSKEIARDQLSAFTVSSDGKLLAVGTSEGDIRIVNSSNMRVVTEVRKAHLGLVTALAFKESRALLSASFDASARVTLVSDMKKNGLKLWPIVFVILLALLVLFMKEKHVL